MICLRKLVLYHFHQLGWRDYKQSQLRQGSIPKLSKIFYERFNPIVFFLSASFILSSVQELVMNKFLHVGRMRRIFPMYFFLSASFDLMTKVTFARQFVVFSLC